MASFYKQGDAWGARVRVNVHERSRSAFKTKREAADWAHEVEGELLPAAVVDYQGRLRQDARAV